MKTVVITGASQGIGAELVKKFSKENGFQLFALARNEKKLKRLKVKNPKSIIVPYKIDLKKNQEIETFARYIKKNKIKINYLLNNAGLLIKRPFLDISYKDLYDVFNVNVFAPFMLVKMLYPSFQKRAHIVNISSIGGVQGSVKFPELSVYSSSKGALAILTECIAEEFKNTDLRFNCLALGATQTKMLKQAFPEYNAPITTSEMASFIKKFTLLKNTVFNGKILPVSISTP